MLIDEEDTTFYFMKRKRALQYLKSKYFKNPDFDGDGSGLETYKKKIHDVFVKSDRNPSKTLNTLFENLEEKKRLLRRKAQIVFQDPMSSLNPRMTVGQMLAEPLLFHKIAEKMDDAIVMVKDLLVKVGLKAYHVDRYPHQFSGGQRQRIAVARAISVNPELIVLDEPTSALDVSVQAQIVNLFEELQEQLNAGYVFISHNLALVRFICQEVSVMYLGRIVEQGDSESIFDAPLHPYTKALLAAAPIPDPNKKRNRKDLIGGQVPSPINRPSGCFFNPRCKYRMDICTREYPQMFKVDQKHFVACHLYSTSQEQGGEK